MKKSRIRFLLCLFGVFFVFSTNLFSRSLYVGSGVLFIDGQGNILLACDSKSKHGVWGNFGSKIDISRLVLSNMPYYRLEELLINNAVDCVNIGTYGFFSLDSLKNAITSASCIKTRTSRILYNLYIVKVDHFDSYEVYAAYSKENKQTRSAPRWTYLKWLPLLELRRGSIIPVSHCFDIVSGLLLGITRIVLSGYLYRELKFVDFDRISMECFVSLLPS